MDARSLRFCGVGGQSAELGGEPVEGCLTAGLVSIHAFC